ncbi:MAG: sulfatase-like hydrolase/transferase, partial [Candidatus Latescibacteria bacterium]|nr:sulfatase-like hydrolase/transferase [Candidatus Latescibacterota bacterium]
MADDHCCQAMSCYGSKTIETPNLDAIAKQGMKFNHMTVTNSLCAPSRAVLLTGKYSHLNGLRSNRDSFDGSQQTFPKLLQQSGYETAIVGKWHLKTRPTGFDYYCLMPGHGRYFDCPMKESHEPWEEGSIREGYLTDVITDYSIDWLKKRTTDKPFCLMVHHKSPHGPHYPAERHQNFMANETLPEPPTLLDTYEGRAPEVIADLLQESRMAICRYPQYTDEVVR